MKSFTAAEAEAEYLPGYLEDVYVVWENPCSGGYSCEPSSVKAVFLRKQDAQAHKEKNRSMIIDAVPLIKNANDYSLLSVKEERNAALAKLTTREKILLGLEN